MPADIETLRVNLKPDIVPVRFKQRRYPPEKKKLMARYVLQLLKLGLSKKGTSQEWIPAPRIVLKRLFEIYWLTVDYSPVNNSTLQTFWSMTNIEESEMFDGPGAMLLASIELYSSNWKEQLHVYSQHLFDFMTPESTVVILTWKRK